MYKAGTEVVAPLATTPLTKRLAEWIRTYEDHPARHAIFEAIQEIERLNEKLRKFEKGASSEEWKRSASRG